MSRDVRVARAREQVVRLCWSALASLGASSSDRRHDDWFIDPEALILLTRTIHGLDPRLDHALADWHERHRSLVSDLRLKLGAQRLQTPRTSAIETHWKSRVPAHELVFADSASEAAPRRPCQFLLRLRACLGLGARTELLGHLLLTADSRPLCSIELSEATLYSKRNINAALELLRWSELLTVKAVGNSPRYSLPLQSRTDFVNLFGPLPAGPTLGFDEAEFILHWLALLDRTKQHGTGDLDLEAGAFLHLVQRHRSRLESDHRLPLAHQRGQPGFAALHEAVDAFLAGAANGRFQAQD